MLGQLNSNKARAIGLTLLAGALWGTSYPVIKIGLNYVDPYTFVFWRFFVAALVTIVIMLATRKMTFQVKQKKLLLFLGITNGVAYLLQYIGMNYTTAAKAALFINLSSLWVALLSPKLLGETWSRNKMVGVSIGVVGIVLVTTNLNSSFFSGSQTMGDLTLLTAGVVWALFLAFNKKLDVTASTPLQSMTWILPLTLIPLVPFAFMSGGKIFELSSIAWAVILYTAVVCWVVPYYLWLEGLKYLSASTSTILLLSQIVLSIALSVTLLHEAMTVFYVVGAALMMGAIAIVSIQSK